MKDSKKQSKTSLNPLVVLGYFVILFVCILLLQVVPYPAEGIAWALAASGYAIAIGVITGLWWWVATKVFSKWD